MDKAESLDEILATADASLGPEAQIEGLRAAGAAHFDAAGLHYLESLASRSAAHQGEARAMLDAKLAAAMTAYLQRFEAARAEASARLDAAVAINPPLAEELRHLFDRGDLNTLRARIAALENRAGVASLGELVRQLQQPDLFVARPSPVPAQARPHIQPAPASASAGSLRPELKTLRESRTTWAKLSVDKQLMQALKQAPKNAGPINSHMLVLRSLALMRDISPDYLSRFMTYADTLLALEPGAKEAAIKPKKSAVKKAAKPVRPVKK